jgi:hypothetical protein
MERPPVLLAGSLPHPPYRLGSPCECRKRVTTHTFKP